MSKKAKIFMYVCFGGIGLYFIRCAVNAFADGFRFSPQDYLFFDYLSVWGAVLVLSCFGLVGLLVSHIIRKRRAKGKKPISTGYKVSFILSYIPYVLLITYCFYCSKFGFDFFSTTYGWRGFWDAFIVMGLIFSVIPVFPFCIFWQILYIVKWTRNRKAAAERS